MLAVTAAQQLATRTAVPEEYRCAAKFYIVQTLPNLIPTQVSIPEFGTASEHVLADMWRSWIAEHREELSLLPPTGEGVEYSSTACKEGRPRERR